MLEILKATFCKFSEAEIRFVHFKSNEHLQEALNGITDLDVLVDRNDAGKVEEIFRVLNYKRAMSQKNMIYPGVDDWIGMDEGTGKLVHFHLHYHLITGKKFVKEYELPWAKLALDTAISYEKFPELRIASPEFEIILLLIRFVLKASWRKYVKVIVRGGEKCLDGDIEKEFTYLSSRIDQVKLEKMIFLFFPSITEDEKKQVIGSIVCGKCSSKDVAIVKKRVSEKIKLGKYGRNLENGIRSRWRVTKYYLIQVLKRKLGKWWYVIKKCPHNGGLSICFIGCDGAGKSTVSREIRQWLAWKYDVTNVYLGSGDGYIDSYKILRQFAIQVIKKSKNIKKIIKGNSSDDVKRELKETRKIIESNSLVSAIEAHHYVVFAKKIRKRLIHMNVYRARGGIALMDRYPQVQFDGINDGIKNSVNNKKMYLKEKKILSIVNEIQPDVVFKLKVPLNVASSRKPSERKETLEEKIQIVNTIAFPESKVYEIDTTENYDEEILKIKHIIWENI